MASPASTPPGSNLSTPSITVTTDDGGGADADFVLPPAAAVGRPQSLTFEIPLEKRTILGVRPKQIGRAKSSEETITKDDFEVYPSQIAHEPVQAPAERPAPLRNGTLKLLTGLKKTLSTTSLGGNNANNKDKGTKSPSLSGKSSAKNSGPGSPKTPEVRELFQNGKKGGCPDLDAVNRALMSLKSTSDDDPYVAHLTKLAAQLTNARTDSRKALLDAMQARDNGKPEVCRAICLSIVQAERTEVDTKVYAYNILSTQASPGQSLNYLSMAWNLVKQHQHAGKRADCEKLLGVIAMLKDNAMAKDGVARSDLEKKSQLHCSAADAAVEDFAIDDDFVHLERVPTIPRPCSSREEKAMLVLPQQPALVEDFLNVPSKTLGNGALSPRTEKILDWAGIEV